MVQYIADRRDIEFVIWEQLDGKDLLNYKAYKEFNRKTCDMIISEARSLAIKELLPTLQKGDEQGIRFENGEVKTPDSFARIHQLLLQGEWASLPVPQDMGGQGVPGPVAAAAAEYFMGANWPLYSYHYIGIGTAEMIHKYGNNQQKEDMDVFLYILNFHFYVLLNGQ